MQDLQHAEEQGLLGSLCPGQKKLEGKTFYLDSVKKRATALLLEAISLLGGVRLHLDCNGGFYIMPESLCSLVQRALQNMLLQMHGELFPLLCVCDGFSLLC